MLGIDMKRVWRAEQGTAELQKEARQKRETAKRKLEEEFQVAEDLDKPSYASGLY